MTDYICPYRCTYKSNSGYCGRTGGYDCCPYRRIIATAIETAELVLPVCPHCGVNMVFKQIYAPDETPAKGVRIICPVCGKEG